MTTATIIKNQISTAAAMTVGASEWSSDRNALIFKVESKRGYLTKFVVTLNGADLYDVRLVRMNTTTIQFVMDVTETDIFCEDLSECIERMYTASNK